MRTRPCIAASPLALVLAHASAWAQGASAPAPAASLPAPSVSVREWGNDTFIFGGQVRVDSPVSGDLIAAGGQVEINAAVAGDAVVAGGEVRVHAPVARNAYLAGGRVRIEAALGRNLRVAGGQVELGPKASVAGNLSASGGQVELRGPVQGSVLVGGGRVTIDAAVQGDVDVTAGRPALGPNARIAGKLRYRGGAEVQRDAQAQVAGGIEATLLPGRGASAPRERARHGERFGWSVLWGFVALVCLPVAALILLVSLIGAPLALVTLLLYGALLPVGYAASALAIGQWGLARVRAAAAARTGWRLLAAVLAVLVLALLGSVPWLGWLVALVVVLAGTGALLRLPPRAAA